MRKFLIRCTMGNGTFQDLEFSAEWDCDALTQAKSIYGPNCIIVRCL